jgi:hypothetical protein
MTGHFCITKFATEQKYSLAKQLKISMWLKGSHRLIWVKLLNFVILAQYIIILLAFHIMKCPL